MKQNFSFKKHPAVQAVIFDWAGTLVDFGCLAPVVMLVDVFKQAGISISLAEARAAMGLPERTHIQQILKMESVKSRWEKKWGRLPTDQDGDKLFNHLTNVQVDSLAQYATLVPSALEIVETLRAQNIKVGATASYRREITEVYLSAVAEQGLVPDLSLVTSAPSKQHLHPYLFLQQATEAHVDRIQACVKVDDTLPGIREGISAEMWTIGVAVSGNEMGLALEQYLNLLPISREEKSRAAMQRLYQAGAHYVVGTIADIEPCLADIETRLRRGETPLQRPSVSQVA